MKKIQLTLIVLSILSLLLVSGCTIAEDNPDNSEEVALPTVSMAELAQHSSEEDCWVAYDGEVYDVTFFLNLHPGGIEAILPYCGTSEEFAAAFTGKHGLSKVSVLMKEGVYQGQLT